MNYVLGKKKIGRFSFLKRGIRSIQKTFLAALNLGWVEGFSSVNMFKGKNPFNLVPGGKTVTIL